LSKARIVLIGAGSAIFSMVLIRDLVSTKGLSDCDVVLMDTDGERLRAVHALATKYASKLGAKVRISKTTSRKAALEGAEFVVNTALAGGHDAQEAMRAVGEEHGYYRGLDAVEFNMVSDYMTIQGYRQLRLALDIATDTHDIAPDAWFLEVANPMFEVTTLIQRESGVRKFAGFCDGPSDVDELIHTVGLGSEGTTFSMGGFNHNIFLTRLESEGEDSYPLIDEWLAKKSELVWKGFESEMDFQMCRAGADMYRRYGLYPVGDTVRSGGWKYHYDLQTKKRWYGANGGFDSEIGWGSFLKRVQRRLDKVFSLANKSPAEIAREFPPQPSEDMMIPFVDSVVTGRKRRMVINVPNRGVIDGLPSDVTVEVPCSVDRRGFHPENVGSLPEEIVEFVLKPRLLRLEWVLSAFETGSREALVDILLRDVRTRSETQAREALDAVLSLPFNEEMKKHYR
jgi:alpha-galactosidase/6-phospho-beta-glucosidase family protein